MLATDEKFMRLALAEARKGAGETHPNPAVGAVIVKSGRVVARGWHRGAGMPHAEIEAFRGLRGTAKGATLYVTLEPCSTHGRTPPCTAAIIAEGFSRVAFGATDPNPAHAGRAVKILRDAGITVAHGILERECAALNTGWNKWIVTGLPYVIAKAGMTLDGRINSPPARRWITNEASRRDAMKLRARAQAILVGGETVRTDNPLLTVRGITVREQPWRVVWTKSGRLPARSRIFTDEFKDRTLVFEKASLEGVLRVLGREGVETVLVEGGARVLGEAFERELVDEVCFYLAPMLCGGPVPVTAGKGAGTPIEGWRLENVEYRRFGNDVRMTGKISRPAPLTGR